MRTNFSSILKAFLVTSLMTQSLWAQDTSDEFEAMMNEPATGEESTQMAPPSMETPSEAPASFDSMSSDMSADSGYGSAGTLTLLNDDPKKGENAMYGWSIGGTAMMLTSQFKIIQYSLTGPDTNIEVQAESKSIGAVLRYAILPVNAIGTDINVSVVNSLDNAVSVDTIQGASFYTVRGELNLAYTFGAAAVTKFYILAGGGVQYIGGGGMDEIVQHLGYGGQAGGGINISKINIDVMYSYYKHRISDDLYKNNLIRRESSFMESTGAVGRVSYNF